MINELWQLSNAMMNMGVEAQSWHRKYKLIPNVNDKAPCVHIIFSNGGIRNIRQVSKEQASAIRKYGTNQGTFPGLNLVPLYRIADDEIKKKINSLRGKTIDQKTFEEIKSLCITKNWNKKFLKKFRLSMEAVPEELKNKIKDDGTCDELYTLMEEADAYRDHEKLFGEIAEFALDRIAKNDDAQFFLNILFHLGTADKDPDSDTGTLSVILDSDYLIENGYSTTGIKFTEKLNSALLNAERAEKVNERGGETIDAFGDMFTPSNEPMPSVKLAGGFEVILRTMFKENRCQERYGRFSGDSYPLSFNNRTSLQSALAWLGGEAHRDKMWKNINKDEILFAYPENFSESDATFISPFSPMRSGNARFEAESKRLIEELNSTRQPGTYSNANRLHIFIIKKIDKGRTSVIYTRVTDPRELEKQSEEWTLGCMNLPETGFGESNALFPLKIADTLNLAWKQDGSITTDKFKPVPNHHGLELLLEKDAPVLTDLRILARSSLKIAAYIGSNAREKLDEKIWWKVKDMLSLMALLLYKLNIEKEQYMNNLAYQYGQLLKISDELHALYCNVVRKGEIPPQLAGSGLYQAAADAPVRTLMQLGNRMNPYITWAKYYRTKGSSEDGKEAWKAGWLLSLYEKTANAIYSEWMKEDPELSTKVAFNDADKAQLFIGFLASFPKRGKSDITMAENNE